MAKRILLEGRVRTLERRLRELERVTACFTATLLGTADPAKAEEIVALLRRREPLRFELQETASGALNVIVEEGRRR